MLTFLKRKKEEKEMKLKEKINYMLSHCVVEEWFQFNEKIIYKVERNHEGRWTLVEDTYKIKNTGGPDYGYCDKEVRRGRPRVLMTLPKFSKWEQLLDLNKAYKKINQYSPYELPIFMEEDIKKCQKMLESLERQELTENEMKKTLERLKKDINGYARDYEVAKKEKEEERKRR